MCKGDSSKGPKDRIAHGAGEAGVDNIQNTLQKLAKAHAFVILDFFLLV